MAVRMRRTGAEEEAVTGQHFLTYRTEASGTDGPYWIRRVPRPILMVRDAGDTIIAPFEPYVFAFCGHFPGFFGPQHKIHPTVRPKGFKSWGPFFCRQRETAFRNHHELAG